MARTYTIDAEQLAIFLVEDGETASAVKRWALAQKTPLIDAILIDDLKHILEQLMKTKFVRVCADEPIGAKEPWEHA